jgi:hypothetical protein
MIYMSGMRDSPHFDQLERKYQYDFGTSAGFEDYFRNNVAQGIAEIFAYRWYDEKFGGQAGGARGASNSSNSTREQTFQQVINQGPSETAQGASAPALASD